MGDEAHDARCDGSGPHTFTLEVVDQLVRAMKRAGVGGIITAVQFGLKAQKEKELRTDAEDKAQQALQVVKEFLTDVSETEMFDEPKLQPMRMKFLERALNFYETFAQQRSDDPDVQADLASTYLRVAEVYHVANRNDDMISYLSKGLDAVDQLRREHAGAAASHQKL